MRLLLDTHIFLWWREDSPRLKQEVRRSIAAADAAYVSVASAWEIAVKLSLRKLWVPGPVEPAIEQSGFHKLHVSYPHAAAVGELPFHHRDPFDRMLIAQARVERLTLVTHDHRFAPYGVPIVWA